MDKASATVSYVSGMQQRTFGHNRIFPRRRAYELLFKL